MWLRLIEIKAVGEAIPSTAAGRVAQNLMSDLATSFGNTTGVSAAGIKDYEERTAASKAAMEKFQADTRNNDSGSSPPPVTTTKPEPEPEPEPQPDPVIEDITPDTTIITDPPAKLTPDTPPDEDAVEEPENTGATEGSGAPDEPDTGAGTTTALGAEEEADELEKVAKGETEKKVAKNDKIKRVEDLQFAQHQEDC